MTLRPAWAIAIAAASPFGPEPMTTASYELIDQHSVAPFVAGGVRDMLAPVLLVIRPWRIRMPEKATIERARKAKRAGRAPTTQAGPFVREEMHHVREGKHGAQS